MNTVCKKDACTGCMACIEKCSKSAIRIEDRLISYNAYIDEDKCIDCGQCMRVCQQNMSMKKTKPQSWYQGWANEKEIRAASSSGGFATAIMAAFIKNKGCVCSCAFENGRFIFKIVDSTEQLREFQGSKYVKSTPEGIYSPIKRKLMQGENVLFIGLPCQVAGIKNFVGEKWLDNLYTADLICHGCPSPQLLKLYLEQHGLDIENLEDLKFRIKSSFNLHQGYHSLTLPGINDRYTYSFLKQLSYTENCYSCQFASVERVSDLTLGDSWGTNLDAEEQKRGISLALCQSEKGKTLLDIADLYLTDVDIDRAIQNNKQLRQTAIKPNVREKFFRMIKNGKKYDRAVFACYPKVFIRQDVKWILLKLKVIRGGGEVISYHMHYLLKQKNNRCEFPEKV